MIEILGAVPLPAPPAGPLWGLDDAWVRTRRRGGSSTSEGWLSYSLIHCGGARSHPAEQLLIVAQELHPGLHLQHGVVTALAIHAGEHPGDAAASQMVKSQLARDDIGPEWTPTTLHLASQRVHAFRRDVPNGFCVAATTATAVLAIYARGIEEPLRLIERRDFMDAYEGAP